MKLLIIAPYLYDEARSCFTKNKTGFGMMVRNIASYASIYNEVYFLSSVITSEFNMSGVSVISHTWCDVLKSTKTSNIFEGVRAFFCVNQGIKTRLKHMYYAWDAGYTETVIKRLGPDIVHFHGAGYRTELGISICERLNVKYVLTLHGLIGFQAQVAPETKESERKLLEKASEKMTPVTVISTGIKNRIENQYRISADNITVVTNGTQPRSLQRKAIKDVYRKHEIPSNGKIMLCVGNVSGNKNQEQLIRAFSLLDPVIKKNLYLLIIGNPNPALGLDNIIKDLALSKQIKLCGFVNRDDLSSYFSMANYNALVSHNEGFGLSIIEGFSYGIPTVTFSDLDAVPDLYDEDAMVLATGRSDRELACAIETLCTRDWDTRYIRQYAKMFSLELMSQKYQDVYLETLGDR